MSLVSLDRLLGDAYRLQGYDMRRAGGDWLLAQDSHRLLLQCKHWKARRVSEMPVRELYALILPIALPVASWSRRCSSPVGQAQS